MKGSYPSAPAGVHRERTPGVGRGPGFCRGLTCRWLNSNVSASLLFSNSCYNELLFFIVSFEDHTFMPAVGKDSCGSEDLHTYAHTQSFLLPLASLLNPFLCRVIIDWRKAGGALRGKQSKRGAPSWSHRDCRRPRNPGLGNAIKLKTSAGLHPLKGEFYICRITHYDPSKTFRRGC